MARCLVTGGAGFIGSHLVEALLNRGHTIRVLDNFSTGLRVNLADVEERIEIREGDLTSPDVVYQAMADVELVFHLGALTSVPRSVADPLATHEVCATGTLHVLQAAREAGVRRVIYAASSSVYGNSASAFKRESDSTSPQSPYAVAKLAGEHYCAVFTSVYGLETVRLRYFNVFGPRQQPRGPYAAVIPLFIEALLANRSPVIHGDGRQSRDFTFVDNVVAANLRAAETPGANGKVYNIACGQRTSLLELVDLLNRLVGTCLRPCHTHYRPGDVRHSQADISRAKAELSYAPSIELTEGLRRCVAYYTSRLASPEKDRLALKAAPSGSLSRVG